MNRFLTRGSWMILGCMLQRFGGSSNNAKLHEPPNWSHGILPSIIEHKAEGGLFKPYRGRDYGDLRVDSKTCRLISLPSKQSSRIPGGIDNLAFFKAD